MFVKLLKINKKNNSDDYYLSEVTVNTSQIVFMAENSDMQRLFKEGKANLDLHPEVCFTDLKLNSSSRETQQMTVVGAPNIIESKILKKERILLRD